METFMKIKDENRGCQAASINRITLQTLRKKKSAVKEKMNKKK